MRILVLFSNPPDTGRLRLDKEDSFFSQLGKASAGYVTVERLHASDVDRAYATLTEHDYDVIHVSGHGSPEGIYLDRPGMTAESGELVTAEQLRHLLSLPKTHPMLVVLLCCYAKEHLYELHQVAPYVVACDTCVDDVACLTFVQGFYDFLVRRHPVGAAFNHALELLHLKGGPVESFSLTRRHLLNADGHTVVECIPAEGRDPLLVNLDDVVSTLPELGMPEEELCFLLAHKLRIHYWVFDVPRDKAIIPIGRALFAEFSWRDAKDVVFCKRLLRLDPATSPESWDLWARLLTSYNDLASLPYRGLQSPADPANRLALARACKLVRHALGRYWEPASAALTALGFNDLIANLRFACASAEKAEDMIAIEEYPQVVQALEMCLTNLHSIVDGIEPARARTGAQ